MSTVTSILGSHSKEIGACVNRGISVKAYEQEIGLLECYALSINTTPNYIMQSLSIEGISRESRREPLGAIHHIALFYCLHGVSHLLESHSFVYLCIYHLAPY